MNAVLNSAPYNAALKHRFSRVLENGTEVFAIIASDCYNENARFNQGITLELSLMPNFPTVGKTVADLLLFYSNATQADVERALGEHLQAGGLDKLALVRDHWINLQGGPEAPAPRVVSEDFVAKARGFVYKVFAAIQPEDGAEAFNKVWYLEKKPTDKQIQSWLKMSKSKVLDQYEITVL
jgi:hypothetical protein